MEGGPGGGGGPIQVKLEDLPRLPLEQLRGVKAQVDQELAVIRDSLESLTRGVRRLQASRDAVQALKRREEGQEVLVPLSTSLYVRGTLGSLDKLIVDIGATYYAEKSVPETAEYCERRISLVKENVEKMVEILSQKEQIAEKITEAMQAKLRAMMGSK